MHVFRQVVLLSVFWRKPRRVHAGRQETGENNPEEEADHASMNAGFPDDRKKEWRSMTMFYFAYGSNLLTERLKARVSSIRPISRAILNDHELRFHKKSTDGSGKCDVIKSPGETVHGVLFKMDEAERGKLDKAEGLGHGCDHQEVEFKMPDGSTVSALVYLASPSHIEPSLKPFDWYHALVIAGALQHSLPADYIERLQLIETVPDPNLQRSARVEALRVLGVVSRGNAG